MQNEIQFLPQLLFRLSPDTYENTLKKYKTSFENYKTEVLQIFYQLMTNFPGCFIQLTFILDLSEENETFFNEFSQNIDTWIKNTDNYENLLILLLNLYFLSQYRFISEESFLNLINSNNLCDIMELMKESSLAQKHISLTRRENDLNRNICIEHQELNQQVIKLIQDHLSTFKKIDFIKANGDMITCYHIINSFSFNKSECSINLTIYFLENDFLNLINGVFLYYTINKTQKYFVVSLFLTLFKVEGFLGVFYSMYESLIKQDEIKEVTELIMVLLYERYYFPQEEDSSYYKTSMEHNPSLCLDEKRKYFEIISNDALEILLRISNQDELKIQLRNEQKYLVPEYVAFNENVKFDLKEIIMTSNFDLLSNYSREDFFWSFLVISRHSISHFLVYLEILKKFFIMDEEEERMFLSIFKTMFPLDTQYRRVVCEKLKFYQFISESGISEFQDLFINK